MTVKELIALLQTLPQDLPVGSMQSHDQHIDRDYPEQFIEFSAKDFEAVFVIRGNGMDIDDYTTGDKDEAEFERTENEAEYFQAVVVDEGL